MLKKTIHRIDDAFFSKALQRLSRRRKDARVQSRIESGLDYKIISHYAKNEKCELSRLCDLYGSDKGELRKDGHPYHWPSHTYADFYSRLFLHCRQGVRKVFECGLGTNNPDLPSSMGISGKPGASLRVWRDFFPNAQVYGADVDRDVLFEEERISTSYIDQLDPVAIADFWKTIGETDFDFMIDDGLHTFEAGSTLFLHSIDRLAAHGIYIIEDVHPVDLALYKAFFQRMDYAVEFVSLFRPLIALRDNNLIVVRKQR